MKAHVEIDGNVILVDAPMTSWPYVRAIPGSLFETKDARWTLPLTWGSCIVSRAQFGENLTVGPKLSEWAKNHRAAVVRPAMSLRTAAALPPDPGLDPLAGPYGNGTPLFLRAYQQVGAAMLAAAREVLCGDDMRTGKTVEAIAALRYLCEQGEDVFPALVVCPATVKRVWRDHFSDWWPDATVVVPKQGTAAAKKAIKAQDWDVLVLNYEAIPLLSRQAGFGSIHLEGCTNCDPLSTKPPSRCQREPKELNGIQFQTVIADEVHRVSEPKAQQTRALWAVADSARYRWGLTGTPPEEPGKFWTVMRFVSPREFPARGRFVDRYVDTMLNPFSGFMEPVAFKPGQPREELDAIVFPHFIRRPKAVVHDLREPIRELIETELLPKQRKAYNDLRDKMVAEVKGGALWAANPLKRMTRLRQLASAFGEITEEVRNGEPWEGLRLTEPSSKLNALEEFLQDLGGEQVAVFAESRQLIMLTADRLGDRAALMVGGQSERERSISLDRFQEGRVQYMLATTGSGGEGISLNAADTLVFLQRPWSRKDAQQAEDRIYTEGRPSFIVELRSPDTVEERVALALEEKDAAFEDLVKDAATIRDWLA